jgi:hypothetical protein
MAVYRCSTCASMGSLASDRRDPRISAKSEMARVWTTSQLTGLGSLWCFLLLPCQGAGVLASCSDGWGLHGGKCYAAMCSRRSWALAEVTEGIAEKHSCRHRVTITILYSWLSLQAQCVQRGGHLAAVRDGATLDYVRGLVHTTPSFWVGGQVKGSRGQAPDPPPACNRPVKLMRVCPPRRRAGSGPMDRSKSPTLSTREMYSSHAPRRALPFFQNFSTGTLNARNELKDDCLMVGYSGGPSLLSLTNPDSLLYTVFLSYSAFWPGMSQSQVQRQYTSQAWWLRLFNTEHTEPTIAVLQVRCRMLLRAPVRMRSRLGWQGSPPCPLPV